MSYKLIDGTYTDDVFRAIYWRVDKRSNKDAVEYGNQEYLMPLKVAIRYEMAKLLNAKDHKGDKYSDAVEHFNNKDEFLEHFKAIPLQFWFNNNELHRTERVGLPGFTKDERTGFGEVLFQIEKQKEDNYTHFENYTLTELQGIAHELYHGLFMIDQEEAQGQSILYAWFPRVNEDLIETNIYKNFIDGVEPTQEQAKDIFTQWKKETFNETDAKIEADIWWSWRDESGKDFFDGFIVPSVEWWSK